MKSPNRSPQSTVRRRGHSREPSRSPSAQSRQLQQQQQAPRPASSNIHADGWDPFSASPSSVCSGKAIICFIALLLMWLTTLQLSLQLASDAVVVPSRRHTVGLWEQLASSTLDERDRHETCAVHQLQACDQYLNASVEAQLLQMEAAAARNIPRVEQARQAASECSAHQWELITAVNRYIEVLSAAGHGAGLDQFHCSDPAAIGLQGQAVSLVDARRTVELEMAAVENRVGALAVALKQDMHARAEYDRTYVQGKAAVVLEIANSLRTMIDQSRSMLDVSGVYQHQIAPVLQLMHDCLGGSGNCTMHPLTGAPSLSRLYDEYIAGHFMDEVATLRAAVHTNTQRVAMYISAVESQLSSAISFIGWIASKADEVLGLFDIPLTIPIISIPTKPTLIPISAPKVPDLDPMYRELGQMQSAFVQQIRMPIDQLQQQVELVTGTLDRLVQQMPGLLDDYRPPNIQLPVTQLQNEMTHNFRAFRGNAAQGLLAMEQAATAKRDLVQPQKLNITVPSFKDAAMVGDRSSRGFEFAEFGGSLDYDSFETNFSELLKLLFLLDIAFRVFQSLRLIFLFWKRGSLLLNPLSVSSQRMDDRADSMSQKTLEFLTSPMIWGAVAGVVLTYGVLIFLAFYLPMYNGYREGCVESPKGTVFSNNTYSMAFNFASGEGDATVLDGLSAYDARRSIDCGRYFEASSTQQRLWEQDMDEARQLHRLARMGSESVLDCIGGFTFDPYLWLNLTGEPLPVPLRTPELPPVCSMANTPDPRTLEFAAFNCSLLPACQISCPGVNKYRLQRAAFDTLCTTEWLVHSGVWNFGMAVLIYICINISRWLFVRALVHSNWHLFAVQDGLMFQTHCSPVTGRPLEWRQKVARLKAEVQSLRRNMGWWTRLMLLGALLANLPWLILLMVVLDDSSLRFRGGGV